MQDPVFGSLSPMAGFDMIMIAAVIVTAVCLAGGVHFARRLSAAMSMRSWQKTRGKVIKAEMRRGQKKGFEGCKLYDPVLRYSYAVGERTFESSSFTHQAVGNAASLAARFIAKLKEGAEVPVYYHPQDPARAVVHPMPWQGSAIGVGCCVLLLALLWARVLLA